MLGMDAEVDEAGGGHAPKRSAPASESEAGAARGRSGGLGRGRATQGAGVPPSGEVAEPQAQGENGGEASDAASKASSIIRPPAAWGRGRAAQRHREAREDQRRRDGERRSVQPGFSTISAMIAHCPPRSSFTSRSTRLGPSPRQAPASQILPRARRRPEDMAPSTKVAATMAGESSVQACGEPAAEPGEVEADEDDDPPTGAKTRLPSRPRKDNPGKGRLLSPRRGAGHAGASGSRRRRPDDRAWRRGRISGADRGP